MENQNTLELNDHIDDLTRYTAQARAVISAIYLALEDDLYKEDKMLSNLVWVVGDRLDDIEKTTGLIKTK